MQPPFHVTGAPSADWIIFIVGAVVCLYWLRALRLAREGARLFLRNLTIAVLIFIICKLVMDGMKVQHNNAVVMSGFFALVAFGFRKRATRRSRYIPAATRRAVIERDSKGEKVGPQNYHIDHIWPFSKGGSNTTDNLRVIPKAKNLKKGAKRPRLREMW